MRKKLIISLVVAALASAFVGCHQPTEKEILGAYTHTFGIITDKIFLQTNGVFRQEIRHVDGRAWSLTDTWDFTNLAICLHQSYQVYDFERQAVLLSPTRVAMSTFIWEGNGLSQYDGRVVWVKSSVP